MTWRAKSARPYQPGEISSGLVGYYRFQRGLVAEPMVVDESVVVTGGTAVLEPGQGWQILPATSSTRFVNSFSRVTQQLMM